MPGNLTRPYAGPRRAALAGGAVFLLATALAAQVPAGAPDLHGLLAADPEKVAPGQLLEHALWLQQNLEEHHLAHGIVFEACYRKARDQEPAYLGNGGDAALFTGFHLASLVYRLCVTQSREDLDRVFRGLQGLHLLTHISGTPGVLARCAIPADQCKRWDYPDTWRGRLFAPGDEERRQRYGRPGPYVYLSPDDVKNVLHRPGIDVVPESRSPVYPRMIFYTRTSRDQLTGVVFGLAVAHAELRPARFEDPVVREGARQARAIAGEITEALFLRLEERARAAAEQAFRDASRRGPPPRLQDFQLVLRDHRGNGGSTGGVNGVLRVALFGLYRQVLQVRAADGGSVSSARLAAIEEACDGVFGYFGPLNVDRLVNPLCRGYFPWNLRFAAAYSLFLVEPDPARQAVLRRYVDEALWVFTRDDHNSFFTFLYNALQGRQDVQIDAAVRGLQELYLRQSPATGSLRSFPSPLFGQAEGGAALPVHLRKPTGYFLWQKSPDVAGGEDGEAPDLEGTEEATGVDFLLPYWLARARGLLGPAELPRTGKP